MIRALPSGAVAVQATVLPDGSFAGTAPLPRRRALHKTRYRTKVGGAIQTFSLVLAR